MRRPIRSQVRVPLPQGDRAGIDQPVDYGISEEIYGGNAWPMAVELGVTIQVLMDYRQLLHDSGVCVQ